MYSLFSYFFSAHFPSHPQKVVEGIDIESGSMPNAYPREDKEKVKDNPVGAGKGPFAKESPHEIALLP